ncbi:MULTISPECIES: hypothetical protein [Shewanella]|uniref:Uncharacterized protein n=1 Tax=Shewanella baltica (strain OS195) TaxID=399599 RepID=A9L1E9_SHEB9|nr:hypothetical protein [Shewanella baltica]ABX49394.1 conserved hypothetical protein [Shewanella baltica OS195]ADT94386.1 hypothetical protein Sbal678_2229 [Shewanella baltica OS678]
MTFLSSLSQQWEKSCLGHALSQKFMIYSQINQFFTGATNLNSVTCIMAALVYNEGSPEWLPKKINYKNLSDEQILNCLLISCQLLFIKAVEGNELSQCERLIFTLSNIWVNNFSPKHTYIGNLINKICHQLDDISFETRLKNKSMI